MPNLNRKEKQFIDSIKFKIQNYNIPVKLKTLLRGMTGTFLHTVYNDDSEEIVDPFIELELIKNSFAYFLDKYTRVDVPGLGTIKMEPYYFQMEMAKEINNYRKVVLDKTRQAGISTIFSLYAFWKAHFFPAEMIDVVSIKQLKAQAFVKKMYPTMESLPNWMKTPVKAQNQQKIIFQHPNGSTSEILSESQSENAGRGDSLSCLILDEAAFYQSERMIRGIVASAQPTLNKTGGQMILVSCVTKDTYIYTDKGLQQVEDYIPKNCKLGFNNIQEFKIDGINHKQSTNTFYDSGITPTKKIYLQNGNMNEISEIHPFYIIDKTSPFPYFKQSKDIKVGEYSLASCREKTFGNNDEFNFNYAFKSHRDKYNIKNFKNIITEDMAYFFGLLLGDGYINFKRQYCIITANDIETQNWLLNNSHFNCKKELRRDDEIHFRLQGKYLITLLKELGFTKEKAKNKSIPKRLLQMSKKNISALLRGLFDSDGHSRTRDGSVGFTSTSKELLKQVKLLLDMFGIQVSDERWNMINPEKSTRVNGESFVGQITLSAYFSKVFYEKIGFNIKRKQEKYEIVKHLKFSNSQSYPDMKIWIKYNLINKHV
ncbi:MAG: LAGLIDADG family homing endonuclease, partial [Nanoarchaeota archaeon]